jgi:hypothetical protein
VKEVIWEGGDMQRMKFLRAALLGCLLILCGCGTVDLKMAYEPATSPVPLRGEKMPRIFLDRVEDKTPQTFPHPAGPTMLRFDPPPEVFLREALQTELGRLGIPVVTERGQADVILQATLAMNGFIVNTSTTRRSTLTVLLSLKPPAGVPIWENTVVGTGTEEATFLTPAVLQRAARRALTSVMDQIGPMFEKQEVIVKIFSPSGANTQPGGPISPSVPSMGSRSTKDLPKIAVWDLASRNTPITHAQELTSILVSEIAQMKKYEVFSQENVRTLAGWTEERMKLGCTSTQCLTALGQMDIAKLLSGSVGKIGDTYTISLNLFDTQNTKAENAVSLFCRSENELINTLQAGLRKLLETEARPSKVEERAPAKAIEPTPVRNPAGKH